MPTTDLRDRPTAEEIQIEIDVTDAMREAGAMKFLQVQSLMCESEEEAAEAIFRAMTRAIPRPSLVLKGLPKP